VFIAKVITGEREREREREREVLDSCRIKRHLIKFIGD